MEKAIKRHENVYHFPERRAAQDRQKKLGGLWHKIKRAARRYLSWTSKEVYSFLCSLAAAAWVCMGLMFLLRG